MYLPTLVDMYENMKKDRALKYQTEKIEHPDRYDRKKKDRARKNQTLKDECQDECEKKSCIFPRQLYP